MSRKKIEAALSAKGITAEHVAYNWQATPHGAEPGWIIQLSDECEEELTAQGYDTNPDCANAGEVMDWIADLPDLSGMALEKT